MKKFIYKSLIFLAPFILVFCLTEIFYKTNKGVFNDDNSTFIDIEGKIQSLLKGWHIINYSELNQKVLFFAV